MVISKAWLRQWERTRTKGKFRYIILYALSFTAAGIVYSMVNYLTGVYDNVQDFFFGTLTYIVVFFVAGFIVSLFLWVHFEKKNKNQLK
jgi:cytochrome c oxidase subunit IV